MTNPNDPFGVIPRGAHVAQVRPLAVQVRTMVEYDAGYMRDRVRADLFFNGHQAGVYAVAMIEDSPGFLGAGGSAYLQRAMEEHAPGLEQMIVDELVGHSYRRRVVDLERQVQGLHDTVAHLTRPRWWQWRTVRDRLFALRQRVSDALAPGDEDPAGSMSYEVR